MTNKFCLLIGFLILGTSCTHSLKRSSSDAREHSMTVNIKDPIERTVPKISEKTDQTPFGPLPERPVESVVNVGKDGVLGPSALLVSAGLYRAVSAISLFRELKVIDKVPPVLMGHGLSAVVVSYFAFGFEADFIEWKFFQFVEKTKNIKLFSHEWNQLFESVLLKEIESKNIEEAKLTLIVPIWDKEQRKAIYLKRGGLKAALIANVNYFGRQSSSLEPAMAYSFMSKKLLKRLRIKKVYVLDLISCGISWKTGDGLLNGSFQKAASIIKDEKNSFDVIINYPLSEYKLDDPTDLADLIFLSKKLAKENLSEFTKEEKL